MVPPRVRNSFLSKAGQYAVGWINPIVFTCSPVMDTYESYSSHMESTALLSAREQTRSIGSVVVVLKFH